MNKKPVRIIDIARHLDLSPSTVSNVLNRNGDRARISKATQERILQAARELGYHKNMSAKRLVEQNGGTPVVAIFWGGYATASKALSFENGVWSQFLTGVMAYMEESGNRCELCIQPYIVGKLADCRNLITNTLYSGIIFVGISEADEGFITEAMLDVPFVIYNRSSKTCASAEINHYASGEMAARLLLETGVRSPVILSSADVRKSGSMRCAGFMDTCLKAGIPAGQVLSIPCDVEPQAVREAVNSLLDKPWMPDGLFVSIGDAIVPVMRQLEVRGISIPRQMRVVVYGDSPVNDILTPTVTSVSAPVDKLAYDCMAMLHDAMRGQSRRGLTIIHEAICCYRESCPKIHQK